MTKFLRAAGVDPLPEQLRIAVGMYLQRDIRRRMATGNGPALSGLTKQNRRGRNGKPLQDSGRLRNSIQYDLTSRGVEIGTNVIYGPIHQEGGVIRPKNAQKLAIPATPTAARWSEALGVRGAIDAFRRNWGPVSFGPGAIFCEGEPIFWRLDEVRIPKREYLFVDEDRRKKIDDIMVKFFERIVF